MLQVAASWRTPPQYFASKGVQTMTTSALRPLAEIASAIGVSLDKVRHWTEALGDHVEKVNRVRHVTGDTADRLTRMGELISGGMTPQQAVAVITGAGVTSLATREPASPADGLQVVAEFRQVILAMADHQRQTLEQVAVLRAEADAARQERAKLAEKVDALSCLIEQRRVLSPALFEPPSKVVPWSPAARPDPMKDKPFWYRAVCSVVSPERFRRQ